MVRPARLRRSLAPTARASARSIASGVPAADTSRQPARGASRRAAPHTMPNGSAAATGQPLRARAAPRSSCVQPSVRAPQRTGAPPTLRRQSQRALGVEGEAERADDDDERHELGVGEAIAGVEDDVAEAGADAEHLGGDEHDPAGADGEAHAGEHVGQDAGDDQAAEQLEGRGGEALAELEPLAGQLAHAGGGVEQDGPDGGGDEQEPDGSVADAERHHRQRHPGQGGDHAQELDGGRGELVGARRAADEQPEGDAEHERAAEPMPTRPRLVVTWSQRSSPRSSSTPTAHEGAARRGGRTRSRSPALARRSRAAQGAAAGIGPGEDHRHAWGVHHGTERHAARRVAAALLRGNRAADVEGRSHYIDVCLA